MNTTKLKLITAGIKDAALIHKLQIEAFTPLYEKYHDDDLSPAKEPLEKIIDRLNQDFSEYKIIIYDGEAVGAVRIVRTKLNPDYDKSIFNDCIATQNDRQSCHDCNDNTACGCNSNAANECNDDAACSCNSNAACGLTFNAYVACGIAARKYISDPNGIIRRISPICILPKCQNKGIASAALKLIFSEYPDTVLWSLDTILEEAGNCHFYEKLGFVRTSFKLKVNDAMTLVGYEKSCITARRFKDEDADEVVSLITRNFKEINSKDYAPEIIDELIKTHDKSWISKLAASSHTYVFCHNDKIVATGSIAGYWGSPTESILLTVFVLPEYHGLGVGRKLIDTLEQDEYFKRASRIEIPASITAVNFYRRFGYDFKNGKNELDSEHLYRLEKFNKACL